MSIVLEGTITDINGDDPDTSKVSNDLNWSGLWKFTKDKKSFLTYSYTLIGNEVPDDLYNYVSFIDESGSEYTIATKVTKYKKKKKKKQDKKTTNVLTQNSRGRGRPRSNSYLELVKLNETVNKEFTVQDNETLPPSEEGQEDKQQHISVKVDEEQMNNNEDDEEDDDDNDEEEEGEEEDVKESNVAEAITDVTSSVIQEEHIQANNYEEDQSILQPTDTAGSSAHYPRVIDNTKHPLLGLWEGHFKVKIATGEENISEVFFFYSMQRTGNVSNIIDRPRELQQLPPDPQFPYAVVLFNHDDNTCTETTVYDEGSSTTIVNAEEHLSSNDDKQQIGTDESMPLESKILPPDSVLLLGFGRNCFGRFSIAGIYNTKTHSLSCEKRYMTSKYPSKRGRRSYAESTVIAIAGNINRNVTQTSSSARLKLSSSNILNNYETNDDNNRDAMGKRKRISFSTHGASSITGTKGKHKEDAKNHRNSSMNKHNKLDIMQAQIASAHAMVLTVAGNNALVGSRDPENDDVNTFYREAFQDCDTGDIYEGGWAYGTRYGKGICVYNDGLMYEGNWILNKEHGRGQLMTGDRQVIYTGDWLDGFMHGYGTYNFGNGDQYMGDWKEGNRHGRGDYTFVNGCRYTGEWKDNKRSGKGIFLWPDKSYYNGEWEQDQRHGRGRLELMNGFSYDGIWVRNVIEGKGISHFPGGQEYEGTYKLGLREGRGTVKFAEGAVYEGRFKEDRFDGQGTLKVHQVVPGATSEELMIPIQVQADFWRIHLRAGFGNDTH